MICMHYKIFRPFKKYKEKSKTLFNSLTPHPLDCFYVFNKHYSRDLFMDNYKKYYK